MKAFNEAATFLARLSVFLGPAMIGLAAFWSWRDYQFSVDASRATGTVIGYGCPENDEGGRTCYATIEFYLPTGQRHTFSPSVGTSPKKATESGKHVEVLYDPKNPERARRNSFYELYSRGVHAGGAGLVLTVIGGVVLLARRIERRRWGAVAGRS